MHELSVASEILRASRAAVRHLGAGRIEAVRIAVGEFSAIEPALLSYAWEALLAGGPDGGARLEIDWRPARQTCPACGEVRERAPGTWLRLCPACGAPLRLEGGGELDLLQVSFTPDGSTGSGEAA